MPELFLVINTSKGDNIARSLILFWKLILPKRDSSAVCLMLHSGALKPSMLTAWCGFRPSWMNALAASLMTHSRGNTMLFHSVADPECLFRIPDPDQNFSIPDPGSKRSRIPDPDPHQRISAFLTPKIDSKLWEIWSGMFIQDPDFFSIPGPSLWENSMAGYKMTDELHR